MMEELLQRIADKYDIQIVRATCIGSRAKRIHTGDSDYDVNFIYMGEVQDIAEEHGNVELFGYHHSQFIERAERFDIICLEALFSDYHLYDNLDTRGFKVRIQRMVAQEPWKLLDAYREYLHKFWQAPGTKYQFKTLDTMMRMRYIRERRRFPPLRFHELKELTYGNSDIKWDLELALHHKQTGQSTIRLSNATIQELHSV